MVMALHVRGGVSFRLGLLTAVSASEEVGWADVVGGGHPHLMVQCLLHLQQKNHSKASGDAQKQLQICGICDLLRDLNMYVMNIWMNLLVVNKILLPIITSRCLFIMLKFGLNSGHTRTLHSLNRKDDIILDNHKQKKTCQTQAKTSTAHYSP